MLIKQINRNIQTPIFFIEIKLDILEYKDILISEIEKGILENSNMNFKTHIKGKMTCFNYFNDNYYFRKILNKAFSKIEVFQEIPEALLENAWGFKIEEGNRTTMHNHFDMIYSGILYLSTNKLPLMFPDLKLEIEPKERTFLLFSGLLKHGTYKNNYPEPKYAIAFNFIEKKGWVE